jgi:O-antigen/teichoic acid export membrane protein
MSLRQAATLGAAQTVVSMALSFLSVKVTSVYLGPAGVGTLGQFTYFVTMAQAVLAAGLNIGLVRRTAELGEDRPARDRVISTVLRSLLIAGIPASLLIGAGSQWLARELLRDASLWATFVVFAAVFVLGLAAAVVLACANGAKDFRTLAFVNIGTGVASLVLITTLSPSFGVLGGVLAMALLPAASWTIAWAFARRRDWWPRRPLAHGFDGREVRRAVAFVPIAVISAVGLPMIQILIRDSVASHSGMAAVGLLQGVVRISDMYLGVATTVFAMYYFPRFSEIRDADELVREARKGLAIIVPSVAAVSVIIYLLRDQIIHLIFTSEFNSMRELFGWQMVGNTLKMVGWLFGYLLLAKANALAMAVLESAAIVVWWLLSVYFISLNGTIGAPQAYAATYALYSATTLIGVAMVVRRMRAQPRAAVA